MDQLGLFIASKSNVFTTFPARSRELRGEVDDDWDFFGAAGSYPRTASLRSEGLYVCVIGTSMSSGGSHTVLAIKFP
jgi:hypothetical protein